MSNDATNWLLGLPMSMQHDAMTLLCDDKLGSGSFRHVYTCTFDKALVVKSEWRKSFHNAAEWEIWNHIKDAPRLAKWFAPCVAISSAGTWLLQKRTTPVTVEELRRHLPRIPQFFDDIASRNWGKLGAHYVCHDYGWLRTLEYGMRMKLVKAKWKV